MKTALFLFSILLYSPAWCQVFVTHAQTQYDHKMVSKEAIQMVIDQLDLDFYFLENNREHWYAESKNKRVNWVHSVFGEHNIKVDRNDAVIMGHNTGACLQHTLIDLIKNYQGEGPFNLHFPAETSVTTGSTKTFADELKGLPSGEQLKFIEYYFSRHASYYNNSPVEGTFRKKKWKKLRFQYVLDGQVLKPQKKPNVTIWVWTRVEGMVSFMKGPEASGP